MKVESIAIAAVCAFLGIQNSYSEEAQDKPLKCSLDGPEKIVCDVVANDVTVKGLNLNMGGCPSPEETRDKVIEANNQCLKKYGINSAKCLTPEIFKPNPDKTIAIAAKTLFGGQPYPEYRQSYHAGDKFRVFISCPTLAEYTFSTSSGELTYAVH
jgi:hypothetical protein